MTKIPKDLIGALHAALQTLAEAPHHPGEPIREHCGLAAAMALDDLLATSYQIVEIACQQSECRPARLAA